MSRPLYASTVQANTSIATGGTTPGATGTLILTGTTVTTSTPMLSATQTWNASGVSFIGASYVFTETASNAGSRYFQILGGAAGTTDEFFVAKGGAATFAGILTAGAFVPTSSSVPTNGMFLQAANTLGFAANSGTIMSVATTGISITGTGAFSSTSTATAFIPTGASVPTNGLYLPASNTVTIATNTTAVLQIKTGVTVGGTTDPGATNFRVEGTSRIIGTETAASFIPTSASAPTNGMYLQGANQLGFACNSSAIMSVATTGVSVTGTGTFSSTATATAFIPSAASIPSNGLYLPGANTVGIAAGSTLVMSISSTGTVNTGTSQAGSFTPTSSVAPANGMYLSSSNVVAMAAGSGTQMFIAANLVTTTHLTSTGIVTGVQFVPSGSSVPTNGMYLPSSNTVGLAANSVAVFTVTNDAAGTTTASFTATDHIDFNAGSLTLSSNVSGGLPRSNTIGVTGAGSLNFKTDGDVTLTPGVGDVFTVSLSGTATALIALGASGEFKVTSMGSDTGTDLIINASDQIKKKTSSRAVKMNERTWDNPRAVLALKPAQFDYINGTANVLGFVSEDVYEAFPEAVNLSDGRPYSNRTDAILAGIVSTLRDLDARLSAMETR